MPGFWLTLPAFIIDNQVPFLPALLIAIGQDQDMAEHMGVNLLRYTAYAFGLSSFFTVIGGILWIQFFRLL